MVAAGREKEHKLTTYVMICSLRFSSAEGLPELSVLNSLAHQPIEGGLSNEKLGRLPVGTDRTECYGPVTVRLLDTASGGSALPGCLGAVAGCFLGALSPVDLRTVCFVRAILCLDSKGE